MRKENLILISLFFLLQCYIGHAIKCYSCNGDCKDMITQDCNATQQCMTREKRNNSEIQETQKGCLNSEDCAKASPDSSITQSCCNTDLCNTANPANSAMAPTTPTTTMTTTGPSSPLVCKKCDSYLCVIQSNVTCQPNEFCFTQRTKTANIPIRKGCTNGTVCSRETSEDVLGIPTAMYTSCCNSTICNFAITLKLPTFSAVGAVLILWITKLS